jgi:hypothetical protein
MKTAVEKLAKLAGKAPNPARVRDVRRAKAQAAAEAFADHPARGMSGGVSVRTRGVDVKIRTVEYHQTDDGGYVDVWVADTAGDPHYRIYNPPVLVEDPQGEIELRDPGEGRGAGRVRRYREDPVAAIAEAIATHGGRR